MIQSTSFFIKHVVTVFCIVQMTVCIASSDDRILCSPLNDLITSCWIHSLCRTNLTTAPCQWRDGLKLNYFVTKSVKYAIIYKYLLYVYMYIQYYIRI